MQFLVNVDYSLWASVGIDSSMALVNEAIVRTISGSGT